MVKQKIILATTSPRRHGLAQTQTITTNIYANKIAIILWTDIPEAVIIKDKSAAEAYRSYFEILWKNSNK